MEALNYTMLHDDGQIWDDLESADIVLIAFRAHPRRQPASIWPPGHQGSNVPLVPGIALPEHVKKLKQPMIVGLIASAERIQQIRRNRVLSLNSEGYNDTYVDRKEISQEINMTRSSARNMAGR